MTVQLKLLMAPSMQRKRVRNDHSEIPGRQSRAAHRGAVTVMPKQLSCDKCGKTPANEDYEGNVFCEYHRAEHRLANLRRDYEEKRKWVERCWLSELAKMQREIANLERFLTLVREEE